MSVASKMGGPSRWRVARLDENGETKDMNAECDQESTRPKFILRKMSAGSVRWVNRSLAMYMSAVTTSADLSTLQGSVATTQALAVLNAQDERNPVSSQACSLETQHILLGTRVSPWQTTSRGVRGGAKTLSSKKSNYRRRRILGAGVSRNGRRAPRTFFRCTCECRVETVVLVSLNLVPALSRSLSRRLNWCSWKNSDFERLPEVRKRK